MTTQPAPASPAATPYLAIMVTTMAVFPLLLVLWGLFVLGDPFALVLVFLYPYYTCVLSVITFLPALMSGWWVARCIGAPGVSECALFVVAVAVHYLMFVCVWDYVGQGRIGPPEQVIPGAVAVLLFLGWIACRKGGVNTKK